jgi:hypothetical protein
MLLCHPTTCHTSKDTKPSHKAGAETSIIYVSADQVTTVLLLLLLLLLPRPKLPAVLPGWLALPGLHVQCGEEQPLQGASEVRTLLVPGGQGKGPGEGTWAAQQQQQQQQQQHSRTTCTSGTTVCFASCGIASASTIAAKLCSTLKAKKHAKTRGVAAGTPAHWHHPAAAAAAAAYSTPTLSTQQHPPLLCVVT